MAISIRKLTHRDAEEYRNCRLDALQDSPSAFATSFEEESARTIDFFRDRFERQEFTDTQTFGAFDGDRIIGLTGIIREASPRRQHKMTLVSVFVRPEYRGKGIASQLVQAALDHARHCTGVTHVELGVESKNKPAIALYERFGFTGFGTERAFQIIDGVTYDELYMTLILR